MRNLAGHLLRVREDERRKVAQEVHDELGQTLTALKMDLHWLVRRVRGSPEAVRRKLKAMIELGEQTIAVVQRISSDLRPKMLDDLGLAPALDWLAADFQRRLRVDCSVNVELPAGLVGGNAATVLYRVVQEALSNVGRHSLARHARVDLHLENGGIVLRVEDDGVGITPAQAAAADSFGLIGIHERLEGLGGTVIVAGAPGKGTTLTARIPLPAGGGLA
jgi:two-component system sensor kinase